MSVDVLASREVLRVRILGRVSDNYEDIFATLELDPKTLEMAHGETITPTIVTSERASQSIARLPKFTLQTPAVRLPQEADYQIVDTLGEGGMGIVSLAEQRALKRLVAVKQPKGEDTLSHSRVLDEAFIMGRVEHPNVVPAYGLGRQDDGRPMLVMKRIEGTSWEDIIEGRSLAPDVGQPDLAWHLQVLIQVCNALRFAHARKIVHRDIKPENVMVGDFGETYLLDWGIALSLDPDADEGIPTSRTASGLAGTPAFMAPEMTIDDATEIDERTDVYLLGATLHMLLTGSPPHDGNSLFAVCMAAYKSDPIDYDDDVPHELASIAHRAMARAKDDRFQSVAEFSAALAGYLDHRASYQLSDAAADMLDELRDAKPTEEGATRLLEAEFGFRQALTIWEENERASDGLQAAVETRAQWCIERGELGGARTAYRQLPAENQGLKARIDALEAELASHAEHVDYLQKFEKDLDLRTGTRSRQRTVILLGLAFVVLCLTSAWSARPGEPGFTLDDWMSSYWRLLAIAVGATLLFWRKLLANVANRRLMVYFASAMIALFVVRFSALEFGANQLFMLTVEQCVMGMAAAAIGIASSRGLALLSVGYAISAILTPIHGEQWISYITLAVAHAAFFGALAWIWRPSAARNETRRGEVRPDTQSPETF